MPEIQNDEYLLNETISTMSHQPITLYDRVFIADFNPLLIEVEGNDEREIEESIRSNFIQYLKDKGLPNVVLEIARKGALARQDVYIGQLVETDDYRTGIVTNITSNHRHPINVQFPNGDVGKYQCHELVKSNAELSYKHFKSKLFKNGLKTGDLCKINIEGIRLAVFGSITNSNNRCIHVANTLKRETFYIKNGIEDTVIL